MTRLLDRSAGRTHADFLTWLVVLGWTGGCGGAAEPKTETMVRDIDGGADAEGVDVDGDGVVDEGEGVGPGAAGGPGSSGSEGAGVDTDGDGGEGGGGGGGGGREGAEGTGDPGGGDPEGGGGAALTGAQYFSQVLYPLFDAQCSSCHADPREMPDVRGPLTIFSYTVMKQFLKGSTSAADSGIMKKVRGLVAHGGGDRCRANGPAASPCKEVAEWWRLEIGADSGLVGRLSQVTPLGEVSGYAVASDDTTLALEVELHVDLGTASAESKTPALTLMADQGGEDAGYEGTHAFRGQLPPALRDGKVHELTAWVEKDGKKLPIGAPLAFAAYTPKAAGRTYFQNTVAPALEARCSSCHVVQYEQQYGSLINPPPYKGGTAQLNEMINRPAGGDAHPGGNLCGSKAGSPCNLLATWWGLEFAP
jgi:hypothetical protein